MQELPVCLVLTTCILFVQCFNIHHDKIFVEKKYNLKNSLESASDGLSKSAVNTESRIIENLLENVKNVDDSDKRMKTEGKTNFFNVSVVPRISKVNSIVTKSQSVLNSSTFSGTKLGQITALGVQNTLRETGTDIDLKILNHSNTLNPTDSNITRHNEIRQDNSTNVNLSFFVDNNLENGDNSMETQINLNENLEINDFQSNQISDLFTNDVNLNFDIILSAIKVFLGSHNATKSSRSITDTIKTVMKPPKGLSPILPYVLAPALTMAGVLPWILPGIRMAAGFVQMMNQMAFMAGLFALVRGYIFDHKPDEHVVYLNHGYHRHQDHSQYSGPKKNT